MNVSLTPDLEELVKRKVDSGAYRSASDVVRDALELLEKRDARKLDALRQKIQHAVGQIEGGEFTEYETRCWRAIYPLIESFRGPLADNLQ